MKAYAGFAGAKLVRRGTLAEVAVLLHAASLGGESVLAFEDATGKVVELDLRGSADDVMRRYTEEPAVAEEDAAPSGRGRPKLGVVAREVTLLPRHWDWLATQPGGASVTLRKLVEEARKASALKDKARQSQEAVHRFMMTMAGDLPGFEEASRALFANDYAKAAEQVQAWPDGVRDYTLDLLEGAKTDHGIANW